MNLIVPEPDGVELAAAGLAAAGLLHRGTATASGSVPVLPQPDSPVTPEPQLQTWNCPLCTAENGADSPDCCFCQEPRVSSGERGESKRSLFPPTPTLRVQSSGSNSARHTYR